MEGKNFGIFHLQWVPMEVTNFHGRPGPVGEVMWECFKRGCSLLYGVCNVIDNEIYWMDLI